MTENSRESTVYISTQYVTFIWEEYVFIDNFIHGIGSDNCVWQEFESAS